jgi:hypothetical protein
MLLQILVWNDDNDVVLTSCINISFHIRVNQNRRHGSESRSGRIPQFPTQQVWPLTLQRFPGYLTSPSGVSEGQSIPHWDGWRERGPLTFLVFSNWEEILVIMPSADMYDKRDSTWVTPWRSILNLFRDQFPCREMKDITLPLALFHILPGTEWSFWEVNIGTAFS